jgi:Asp-tRNA(Asn)/Glu-tRNA(Gln) amidotransferase A subunit family amidase
MNRARTTSSRSTSTFSKGHFVTASTRRALAVAAALATVVAGCVLATPATAAPAAAPAPAPASAAFLAPYYTELDQTGDDQVTADDLAALAAALGATSKDPQWEELSKFDLDDSGSVTVEDLADLSKRIIYDDGPFEIVEASVVDMQAAMNAGVTTSVALTQEYIDRITAYDRVVQPGGVNPLNSIITVGEKTALAAAAVADTTRAEEGMTSMLLGIPVALKDNYNTVDMPTSAGCGCWTGNQTTDDARMVEGLRADGAVVLAKASMDEFAINLSSTFSAGSDAGSALNVYSPYSTGTNAGGSSGGTGASIAANFAAVGFGTDTGGSIRVPSHNNQLVGVRPTVGLASRDGIVPLALSQDTGGPMARSVTDAAVALDAVVGIDPNDAVTARQEGLVPESYTSYLDADALKGARIGWIRGMFGTGAALNLWLATIPTLEAQGATVYELTGDDIPADLRLVFQEGSGSGPEFNHDLQNYIAAYLNPTVTQRSLAAISEGTDHNPGRGVEAISPDPNVPLPTYVARSRVTESAYQAWAGPEGTHTRQLAAGKVLVNAMLDAENLDTLVYPTGDPYSPLSYPGNGSNARLSPNTGLPVVSVPMGQTAAGGASNVNLEFLGRDFAEGPLLGLAYSFEQATHARTSPALYGPLASATPSPAP